MSDIQKFEEGNKSFELANSTIEQIVAEFLTYFTNPDGTPHVVGVSKDDIQILTENSFCFSTEDGSGTLTLTNGKHGKTRDGMLVLSQLTGKRYFTDKVRVAHSRMNRHLYL